MKQEQNLIRHVAAARINSMESERLFLTQQSIRLKKAMDEIDSRIDLLCKQIAIERESAKP
jgi:hypothetical protein